MIRKLDCGSLPWLAAGLTIIGAGGKVFLPSTPVWLGYVFFSVVAVVALVLAWFGWECHKERQLPAPPIRKLLKHLAEEDGFSGTPADFNKHAERVLHGEDFSAFLPQSTDFYSSLMSSGFIQIRSVTDSGNKPDGTPDTTVALEVTDKGRKVVAQLGNAI